MLVARSALRLNNNAKPSAVLEHDAVVSPSVFNELLHALVDPQTPSAFVIEPCRAQRPGTIIQHGDVASSRIAERIGVLRCNHWHYIMHSLVIAARVPVEDG